MLQDGHAAWTKAALAQQTGNHGGAAAVVAQHQQTHAMVEVRVQRVQRGHRPGNHRQGDDVLQGPAEAGGGQRIRGGRRQNTHFVNADHACKTGADAEHHRVATGQHADLGTALLEHRVQRERAGPRTSLGANARRQQRQLARAAEHLISMQQRVSGVLAEPLVTVFSDSHDCQPRRHVPTSIRTSDRAPFHACGQSRHNTAPDGVQVL